MSTSTTFAFHNGLTTWFCVLILSLLSLATLISTSERNQCPSACQCVASMLNCKQPGLRELPPAPSPKLEMVVISNQTFRQTVLDQNSLRPYWAPEFGGEVRLKLLKIRFCNIKSLAPNTFANLGTQLEELDLSGNPLQTFDANVFSGLRLKSLFLNNLPNPTIDDSAFSGTIEIITLSLQNSKLSRLPFHALQELTQAYSLKTLNLHGNNISRLEPAYEGIFRNLQTFDVSENPWNCDCNLRWLIQLYRVGRTMHPNGKVAGVLPMVSRGKQWSPVCSASNAFTNYDFDQIALNETDTHSMPYFTSSNRPVMICEVPQLKHIEIDLRQLVTADVNQKQAILHCQMTGSPDLHIDWVYHSAPGKSQNVTSLSKLDDDLAMGYSYLSRRKPANQVNSRLSVSKVSTADMYTCTGSNLLGNVSATVRIHWPPSPYGSDVIGVAELSQSAANLQGTQVISRLQYEQSGILSKRYSLMDVIGAVVGTFLITVLLFLIAYRCSRSYCYRKSKCHSPVMLSEPGLHDPLKRSHPSITDSSFLKFSHESEAGGKSSGYIEYGPSNTAPTTSAQSQSIAKSLPPVHLALSSQQPVFTNGFDGLCKVTQSAQRDSGTYNSHSTVSSATANGHGAYETVYNEPNQIIYDTTTENPASQTQAFLYQMGSMAGYPLGFSGTLPITSATGFTQLPTGTQAHTHYPTYIPPPPVMQQPSLPRNPPALGPAFSNKCMFLRQGREPFTEPVTIPANQHVPVLATRQQSVPAHSRVA